MTEQSPDPDLKENNYRKWAGGQSTEALEKELRTLELRRMLLQKKDPEEEARLLDDNGEAEWEALTPEQQAEANWNTLQELEKPESLKQDEYIMKLYADPEKLAELEIKRQAQLAAMEPEERAQLLGEMTPSISEQLQVAQQLEAVKRELAARRTQELSKGEAASALAGAPKLPKSPAGRRWPRYPSKIKQAILAELRKDPGATDLEVCQRIDKRMDKNGTVKLIASWSKGGKYRLFADACTDTNPNLRQKVHSEITRVRTDLRNLGWTVPRRRGPRSPLTSPLSG